MRVLAADLSLARTGWCDGDTAGVIKTLSNTPRVQRIEFICDVLLWQPPDLLVVEGPSYASRGSATIDLGRLHGVLEHQARDGGTTTMVPFAAVAPSSVKKYATGKGNAGKAEVLTSAVRRLGYDGSDDNVADAMWLHAAVMDALGQPTVDVPKVHREALPAVRKALGEAGVDCEGEAA